MYCFCDVIVRNQTAGTRPQRRHVSGPRWIYRSPPHRKACEARDRFPARKCIRNGNNSLQLYDETRQRDDTRGPSVTDHCRRGCHITAVNPPARALSDRKKKAKNGQIDPPPPKNEIGRIIARYISSCHNTVASKERITGDKLHFEFGIMSFSVLTRAYQWYVGPPERRRRDRTPGCGLIRGAGGAYIIVKAPPLLTICESFPTLCVLRSGAAVLEKALVEVDSRMLHSSFDSDTAAMVMAARMQLPFGSSLGHHKVLPRPPPPMT
ncbi:hypothetical protein EVAR_19761_1 [Eumeta japonica]|uniref:Uncharacterized protein n=1 Tax=Eumeta variegata TaxID=151549 RepID=A0A4C1UR84_EUMVA|nr:hypothetical protein EVAR_19761_1 [Eumeta japonica]